MRVNQDTQHTKRLAMFDEADPAHVRCEVINFAHTAGHSFLAGSAILQVKCQVLHVFKALVPLFDRIAIDCANGQSTSGPQPRYKPAADEAASSAYQHVTGSSV